MKSQLEPLLRFLTRSLTKSKNAVALIGLNFSKLVSEDMLVYYLVFFSQYDAPSHVDLLYYPSNKGSLSHQTRGSNSLSITSCYNSWHSVTVHLHSIGTEFNRIKNKMKCYIQKDLGKHQFLIKFWNNLSYLFCQKLGIKNTASTKFNVGWIIYTQCTFIT